VERGAAACRGERDLRRDKLVADAEPTRCFVVFEEPRRLDCNLVIKQDLGHVRAEFDASLRLLGAVRREHAHVLQEIAHRHFLLVESGHIPQPVPIGVRNLG
jgi:hypothetical protein